MIRYSTDKEKRFAILFIIAAVSIFIGTYLTAIFKFADLSLIAPSGVMIFFVLIWTVDITTLYIPKCLMLFGLPNFSGDYQCTMIQVVNGEESESNAQIVIKQSLNMISIYFESNGCTSTATSVGICIHGGTGSRLEWNYNALDKTGSDNPNKYGPGTTYVTLTKSHELQGRYFTSKGNHGQITMVKNS